MGFFTTSKPLVTKEEKVKIINELHGKRGMDGNRLLSDDHLKYIERELDSHLDADAPGQYPGITQEEGAQVLTEMTRPNPLEQEVQRRFGVKHGFNQEQAGAVKETVDKYLKR